MKNLNKFLKFIIILFLVGILKNFNVYGIDAENKINFSNEVSLNKKFTVNFSGKLIKDDYLKHVYVVENETGKKIPITASLSSEGNKLYIEPVKSYDPGKEYTLFINKSIQSTKGKKLSKEVKLIFKTKNSNSTVNNYEEYYNSLKAALENCNSELVLNIKNYNDQVFNLEVVNKIIADCPDVDFGYEGVKATIFRQGDNSAEMKFYFKYYDSRENLLKKKREIDEKVSEIVSALIKPEMTELEKEKALHDYIVNSTKYDIGVYNNNESKDAYNAYGALIEGKAVCQGYAIALYKLLKATGLEAYVVIGEGRASSSEGWIGHAWNIVKINNKYYHVDSTWDDPISSTGKDILSYEYFNISDYKISKDHRWDKTLYPLCK